MTFRATADFSEILKQAQAAGKQSGDLFSRAMSSSLGGMGALKSQFGKLASLQKKIDGDHKKFLTEQASITKRQYILELAQTNKLTAHKEKAELELDRLRAKIARAAEARDQKELDNLKEQREVQEDILKVVREYNSDAGKFTDDLKKATKEFDGTIASLKSATGNIKLLTGVAGALEGALDTGFERGGERLTEMAEGLGDAFVNGIDVTALTKKLSSGLGKGLGKAGDALGASGGGGAKALGAVVGSLGMVVGVLGALVAAFVMFDKKIKEFNKDIIKTHGALSVMRLGAGNLNDGLTTLKHTVMDLSGNFGVSEEEAKQLFASLDNGNLTLRRLSLATFQGQSAQAALSASLRDTYTAANLTGVGLSEYADNLANYVNDLGMSTQTVNDNFRSIAKMASESAFSTRRFYSMVVQATSGQSSLNVSMDQTGDLLLRMSRIMGMKKAAEMAGGASADMGGMSATERIKTLIVAGGRGSRVFNQEARAQAGGFSTSHRSASDQSAIGQAAVAGLGSELGRTISNAIRNGETDPDALVRALGGLQVKQQQQLVSSLRNTGATPEERATNAETARQLDQLILVTRGAQGNRSDRVAAMGGLSAGGSMAMRAAQMRRFMNPDGRVSEINRAAAENVSGMSGHQMDSFLSLMQANAGDMAQLRSLSEKKTLTPAESQILKQLQQTHHVTARNGHIMDRSGRELTSSDELLQTNPERTALAIEKTRTEAESIAVQTMDATVSVADIMENKISQILQNVYDVLNGPINAALTFIVDHFPGMGGGRAAAALKTQHDALQRIDEKIAGGGAARTKRARDIASARVMANASDASEADRTSAKQRLAQLQADEQRDSQALAHMREIRSSIASGNTYYTREGAGHNDFMNTTQNMTNIPQGWRRGPNGTVVRDTGAPAASAAAATASPGTAAPVAAPPPPAHVEAATAPVVAATEDVQAQAQEQHQQIRRETRQRDRQSQVFNEKLLKGKDLGDGLAMSKLPDAIAEAQLKLRLTEDLMRAGKTTSEIAALLGGQASGEQIAGTGESRFGVQALRDRAVHDFISQDRGGRTVITPIDRADQVMGMKPGGPVANAGARAGGNVNINIHGGDERRVFEVVRRAINQSGITPSRVPGTR